MKETKAANLNPLPGACFLVLCGALLCPTSQVQAANYFSWGVEGSKVDYGVNGPGVYNVAYQGATTRDCTVHHSGSCSMRLNVIGDDNGNQSMGIDLIQWNPDYS